MAPIRQLLYVSSGRSGREIDLSDILAVSRRNNAIDGVTGLLYTDGKRFLQVLEGGDDAVDAVMRRIRGDDRHGAIVVLADRRVETREFGTWEMADRAPGEAADKFDDRIRRRLDGAAPQVRETFLGLIAARVAQAARGA